MKYLDRSQYINNPSKVLLNGADFFSVQNPSRGRHNMSRQLALFVFILVWIPTVATAIPNIWGVWNWELTENAHILVTPGGAGTPLSDADNGGGGQVDATIRIQLWMDEWNGGDPIIGPVVNFPFEDIWLEIPGLNNCMGGTTADASTDSEGWFTFSGPLGMGGWNDPSAGPPVVHVMVNGSILLQEDGSPISPSIVANSPDINGDLATNLTDVADFAADYYGAYHFRSDLFWDGIINLSDVPILAASIGEVCP